MKKPVINVPNALSVSRILLAPVVFACIFYREEKLFLLLISYCLISDVLDGWIARKWNLQTSIGARLDMIGDLMMYALMVWAVCVFKWAMIEPYVMILFLFVFLFSLNMGIEWMMYSRYGSFKTLLYKITFYLEALLLIYIFTFDFNVLLFYIVQVIACIAALQYLFLLISSGKFSFNKNKYL